MPAGCSKNVLHKELIVIEQLQRGQWLGQGFYGFTDGWATVRAGQALFMTTTARWGRGSSVNSTQMDAAEAVG